MKGTEQINYGVQVVSKMRTKSEYWMKFPDGADRGRHWRLLSRTTSLRIPMLIWRWAKRHRNLRRQSTLTVGLLPFFEDYNVHYNAETRDYEWHFHFELQLKAVRLLDLEVELTVYSYFSCFSVAGVGKKKRKSRGDFKQRYRKTFAALLEEEVWCLQSVRL